MQIKANGFQKMKTNLRVYVVLVELIHENNNNWQLLQDFQR